MKAFTEGHEDVSKKLQQANKDLAFYIQEKEKREAELVIANKELVFQNHEKENRAAELIIANKELVFQNHEKENRAAELVTANKELFFQNEEKKNRAAELVTANKELFFQNHEKANRAAELVIANKELVFQNQEKEKRAAELVVANKELVSRTKALSESEALFRNMMETISQLAWTVTVKAEASFFNRRWYKYTGMDYEQAKSQAWDIVIHPDDLQQSLKPLSLIQNGSKSEWTGEIRYKRADGIFRWHLVSILPILNEYGEVQLWIGTATDIHDLKHLQQQKDDFISIASHELKTPITTLKASLQLMGRNKNKPSPKILDSLVERANKSIAKVSTLVEDLLNASKFNHGQLHLNKTMFTIAELIGECYDHINIEEKYIIKIAGEMNLQVYADKERIGQVIINFINNAIKYAGGSKEININIEKINNKTKVCVTDEGPGITPDKTPHLFERFYRADSTGSQYSGLGLGLYICSEIIKKHEGKIGVNSKPGKGSTFWFILPPFPGEKTDQ